MLTPDELDSLMQNIEGHLQSPDLIDEQVLLSDATSYSDLCHSLNRKLAEASRLIDRGLRDDALKQMGGDAEVLTVFERVDFPERADWCELLEIYGIASPPKLNMDAATKVNQTFAILGDLQGLLKNHRILALARAPLASRLSVLYALFQKDMTNPIWELDLNEFRKVRVQQMAREVERAIQAEDYPQIQALTTELESPVLGNSVDPKILASTRTALATQSKREWMQRVQTACGNLQAAYAEFDVQSGFEWEEQVLQLFQESRLEPSSSVLTDIQPARDWLQSQRNDMQQQQRDRELIAALESSLENSTKSDPIERDYQRALSMGSRLPPALQQRAIERLESFQLLARRRLTMIAGSTMAVLLMIAGSLGYWIYTTQREAAAVQVETLFEDLIGNGRLDEADALAEKQSQEILARSKMQTGMARISSIRAEEVQRVADFNAVLDQLNNDTGEKPKFDLVEKLRGLAKSVDENLQVREQETKAEKIRLELARQVMEKAKERFQAIEKSVKGYLADRSNPTRLAENLKTEKSNLIRLVREESEQKSVVDLAQQLERQINMELLRIAEDAQMIKGVEAITASVGELQLYNSKIQECVTRHATSLLAAELDIPARMDEFNKTQMWLDLAMSAPANPYKISSDSAEEWLRQYEQANALAKNHCLQGLTKNIEPGMRRQALVRKAIDQLTNLSESRLLDKMYIYPHLGVKYYSLDAPGETKKEISYLADFSFAELEKKFPAGFVQNVLPNVRVAGHSEFGVQMRKILQSLKEDEFSVGCFKILSELNKIRTDRIALKEPYIDPLFKLFLYRRLLEQMLPASEALEEGFGDFSRGLTDDLLDWDTNWLSVETKNPELNATREKAEEILGRVSNWDSRKQKMAQAFTQGSKRSSRSLQWIGWVGVQGDKRICLLKKAEPGLELVAISYADRKSEIVKLGVCSEASFPLPDNAASLPVGSAIYALTATD